jgi:hypothetical protein
LKYDANAQGRRFVPGISGQTNWRTGVKRKLLGIVIVLGSSLAVPSANGQGHTLAMLDQLQPGRWEIRLRDGSRRTYPICATDGRKLIQLRHDGQACDRVIVADSPNAVTVQYTCRGAGYGRTSIRMETSQLVQIDTQGIADGLPFDYTAEGRRTGPC